MSRKALTYGIVTTVVVVAFVGPGIANLIHLRHIVSDMTHLGYPSYFPTILGTWKLLGAAVVAAPGLPRAKEWAYAGMIFDLTGAAISRAVVGDGAGGVIPPLLITGLVIASWALRPKDRVLQPGASK